MTPHELASRIELYGLTSVLGTMTSEDFIEANNLVLQALRSRESLIEECVKVCLRVKENAHWTDGVEAGAELCAAAIRAIKAAPNAAEGEAK